MNKLELIDKFRLPTGITKPQAKKVMDVFFESITYTLANGQRVEIRDFCSFLPSRARRYSGSP